MLFILCKVIMIFSLSFRMIRPFVKTLCYMHICCCLFWWILVFFCFVLNCFEWLKQKRFFYAINKLNINAKLFLHESLYFCKIFTFLFSISIRLVTGGLREKTRFHLHFARVSPFDYRQIKSLTKCYWCYILWFYSMVLFHGSPLSLPLFCSISILIPFDYMNEKCFHTHTYIICCFSNSILNFIFLNSMMLSSSFRHRIDCARATLSIQNNRKMLIWNERT